MKKEKEICASFAVALQTAKVTTILCKCLVEVKKKKGIKFIEYDILREKKKQDHVHITFITIQLILEQHGSPFTRIFSVSTYIVLHYCGVVGSQSLG